MVSKTVYNVDFEMVIDRLKDKLVVKSNRALSALLGMSSSGKKDNCCVNQNF